MRAGHISILAVNLFVCGSLPASIFRIGIAYAELCDEPFAFNRGGVARNADLSQSGTLVQETHLQQTTGIGHKML